jgi:hypothetical protein
MTGEPHTGDKPSRRQERKVKSIFRLAITAGVPPSWNVDLFQARINQEIKESRKDGGMRGFHNKFQISCFPDSKKQQGSAISQHSLKPVL